MTSKLYKSGLLAGASALAIGLCVAAPSAQAFEKVKWNWYANVYETVKKYVDVDIFIDPTGMVMLEDLQIQIGDVKAYSEVAYIWNDPPEDSGGIPSTLDVQWHYGLGGGLLNDGFNSPEVLDANVDETDIPPDVNGTVTATIDLSQFLNGGDAIDAPTHLPEVVSAATAVGNNVNIESDVPVELHEGQFVFNASRYSDNGSILLPALVAAELLEEGFNYNLAFSAGLTLAAITGAISPAEIKAESYVHHIKNASVDSTATAVGNNLSVAIDTPAADNGLLIGDATQFAFANVTAKSKVHDVYVNDYVNLGDPLGRPLVNSVATAVGNNKSITVHSLSTPVIVAP